MNFYWLIANFDFINRGGFSPDFLQSSPQGTLRNKKSFPQGPWRELCENIWVENNFHYGFLWLGGLGPTTLNIYWEDHPATQAVGNQLWKLGGFQPRALPRNLDRIFPPLTPSGRYRTLPVAPPGHYRILPVAALTPPGRYRILPVPPLTPPGRYRCVGNTEFRSWECWESVGNPHARTPSVERACFEVSFECWERVGKPHVLSTLKSDLKTAPLNAGGRLPVSRQRGDFPTLSQHSQCPKFCVVNSCSAWVALYRAMRLRFGYGFESCDANGPRNSQKHESDLRNTGPSQRWGGPPTVLNTRPAPKLHVVDSCSAWRRDSCNAQGGLGRGTLAA